MIGLDEIGEPEDDSPVVNIRIVVLEEFLDSAIWSRQEQQQAHYGSIRSSRFESLTKYISEATIQRGYVELVGE